MAVNEKEHPAIWFAGILLIIAATNVAVFLDIPFLRQLLGVTFLTVIPGLLFLFLLKLNQLPLAEKLALVVGLSITFLMVFGWGLNQASLAVGYMSPLSTTFLTVSLSLALIVLGVAAYLANRGAFSSSTFRVELNTQSKLCLILPAIFLFLSITGCRVMNTSGNNIILMALLFLVPVSIILIFLRRHKVSSDTFPLAIIMISAALISMFWLRSEHVLGHDIHLEYYFFQNTLLNQHWSIFEYATLNSCLSITVLPTVYQSLLNVEAQEQLFKGLYALIGSLTPLVVYAISRRYLTNIHAFMAALFVASGGLYLYTPGTPRFSVAIFFFALSIMVLFNREIPVIKRKGLFIALMIAVIVSHYATAYIFFFVLLFVILAGIFLRRNMPWRMITLTSLFLFFVLIFMWYSQLTEAPFVSAVGFIARTIRSLGDFLVAEMRSQEALTVLGGGGMTGNPLLSWGHFAVTWFCFILIAIGIISTLFEHKKMLLVLRQENSISTHLKAKFDIEYFLMAIACCGLLVVMLVLPLVSIGYETQRGYTQAVIVLSAFFVLGGVVLAQLWRANLLIITVLILYFLFNSGALYELTGIHDKTWLLSTESPAYRYEFVHDQETLAIRWLQEHREDDSRVYALEGIASAKLTSQALIPLKMITREHRKPSYLFLSYNNVVGGEFVRQGQFHSMDERATEIMSKNKLYANGGSEIYR